MLIGPQSQSRRWRVAGVPGVQQPADSGQLVIDLLQTAHEQPLTQTEGNGGAAGACAGGCRRAGEDVHEAAACQQRLHRFAQLVGPGIHQQSLHRQRQQQVGGVGVAAGEQQQHGGWLPAILQRPQFRDQGFSGWRAIQSPDHQLHRSGCFRRTVNVRDHHLADGGRLLEPAHQSFPLKRLGEEQQRRQGGILASAHGGMAHGVPR
jgi:hypothetical protein